MPDTGRLLAQVLWNRGLRTREEAEAFLAPSWEAHIHDAKLFRRMDGAVAKVLDAVKIGEKITVHGDYDADGVTGSTMIITVLKKLGADVDSYIPHRDKEGYGLSKETVGKLKTGNCKLIITVDCGIACVDEIALAKNEGMETVVVDHHTFGENLPDGHLIHPGLPDETYPFKHLAAVGVSYKFCCSLIEGARLNGMDIPAGYEKWLLDLVAIATVTDMVPLIGENRVLETYGLKVFNKTKRPGLQALMEIAGVAPGSVTSETIGFAIGPRINAAGRMDHASLALRLLLSESIDEARILAQELELLNKLRQDTTRKMMAEAEKMHEASDDKIIVLWKEAWSPSLVGLIAGRYLEQYSRPVVAIGSHDGNWIGSGRSISAYNITDAVKAAGEGILTRSGGHVQACGFALDDGTKLDTFKARLIEHASAIPENELIPQILIDAELPLSAVTSDSADSVAGLEPFGMGNPKPIFATRGVRVLSCDTMGASGSHLRLSLVDENGRKVKAVGFKMGKRLLDILHKPTIDIAYTIAMNEWQGMRNAECHLVDFQ
ncbi:single-stranded-DNA-specific exonuclease RecJ [Candidatus Uhrbacteria bacterium]|nr:single-stranded-DNA-specific exonuclease RecJ [Candidatus Uhrbacteria bacterium]